LKIATHNNITAGSPLRKPALAILPARRALTAPKFLRPAPLRLQLQFQCSISASGGLVSLKRRVFLRRLVHGFRII
jgi:hypothetical protein